MVLLYLRLDQHTRVHPYGYGTGFEHPVKQALPLNLEVGKYETRRI